MGFRERSGGGRPGEELKGGNMRTIFETGFFTRDPWTPPRLGFDIEETFGELLETGIKEAPGIYKAYTQEEKAEEERKAAEARAAAAQAQAQAAQAQAKAAEATKAAQESGKILGIPTPYMIVGGLGLLGIAAVVLIATR